MTQGFHMVFSQYDNNKWRNISVTEFKNTEICLTQKLISPMLSMFLILFDTIDLLCIMTFSFFSYPAKLPEIISSQAKVTIPRL